MVGVLVLLHPTPHTLLLCILNAQQLIVVRQKPQVNFSGYFRLRKIFTTIVAGVTQDSK